MSDIPEALVDKMMVKCGRRCCICRRYRPTKLQVHHIEEKSQGGTNDEDNLIVTCMSCHSDVHTIVPFARRFTHGELKGHRDALVKAVEEGRLSLNDKDDTDEAILSVVQAFATNASTSRQVSLLPEAVRLLIEATNAQGHINAFDYSGGYGIVVNGAAPISADDHRTQMRYKHAVRQLIDCHLLEQLGDALHQVTYNGYLVADEIKARGVDAFTPDM